MDRTVYGVAKNRTQLSNFHFGPGRGGKYTYSKSDISSFYSMIQMHPNHMLNTIDIQLRIDTQLIQCYFYNI